MVGRPPLTLTQDEAVSKGFRGRAFELSVLGHTTVCKHSLGVLGTAKPLNSIVEDCSTSILTIPYSVTCSKAVSVSVRLLSVGWLPFSAPSLDS